MSRSRYTIASSALTTLSLTHLMEVLACRTTCPLNAKGLLLLCHKSSTLDHTLAARAARESLCQCAGDRHTERGNRVADVPLRSDREILGVGNHGIEEAF